MNRRKYTKLNRAGQTANRMEKLALQKCPAKKYLVMIK